MNRIRTALAVAGLVAVTALTACSGPDPNVPHPVATGTHLSLTGPVLPPTHGALFGAWVKPLGPLTQPARIDAVTELEGTLGRGLDIVNTYKRFDDPFPTQSDLAFAESGATLMVSWATGDTEQVAAGLQDSEITAWAKRFKAYGHPIMLRMRWEMDRPNLRSTMHTGADFVAAWKHTRQLFAAAGVTNVSWVWCPTAAGFTSGTAQKYYPGDAEVDWSCVDVYSSTKLQPLSALLQPFLKWAAGHPKPIIIGEFGVAGAYPDTQRAAWLAQAAREFQDNPQIKAVCYFDSDPDGAIATQSFALPPGSRELTALAAMARTPYFNPTNRS